MNGIEYEIADIRCKLTYIADAMRRQEELDRLPEFITLEQAAKLKGGASLNTYKSRQHLQPCGGTNSVRVGGRKCWRKELVVEWLTVDDSFLELYLEKFGAGTNKD